MPWHPVSIRYLPGKSLPPNRIKIRADLKTQGNSLLVPLTAHLHRTHFTMVQLSKFPTLEDSFTLIFIKDTTARCKDGRPVETVCKYL